ncbi:GIY-YIG nuclease family protein [Niveispirillum sp. SYP-B3756]|uniref:GIY-YIG nuclease family protein n=1 Tax=Niveispirillum sp. SYP-B3756 TaxID=2662178 RepID=UPI0012908EEC|nr:GIY-YIG nuclease family protein [Niveispirillum sp. SYP-B3756]MQP66812.1 GIY-YIG nuclease family protein [Niveispirillum sp. SYP-B3756]
MPGYVYILASTRNGTLYIGVTSDISRRIYEHREGLVDGFTKKYGIATLVYCETFDRIDDAIRREKQMKEWKRDWKIRLVESANPDWNDLAGDLL